MSRLAKLAWETSRLVGSLRFRLLRVLRGFDLLPMLSRGVSVRLTERQGVVSLYS